MAVPDPLPEPYTSLFKQAKEAPTEFNTWTSLISAAEKLVRLDCFLVLMLGDWCCSLDTSLGAQNVGALLLDGC